MLFKAVVWIWKNAFAYPLSRLGLLGRVLAAVVYPVLVYLPGMALAFLAYLLYPPKIVVQTSGVKQNADGG